MKWLVGVLMLCLCAHSLEAENEQPLCMVQLINTRTNVFNPDRFSDYWTCSGSCLLSNGLEVCIPRTYWLHECQAIDEAETIAWSLKGKAALEFEKSFVLHHSLQEFSYEEFQQAYRRGVTETFFKLRFLNSTYGYSIKIELHIPDDADFKHLSKIISIKEDVQEVDDRLFYFFNTKKQVYFYMIELSDGTSWMTKEQKAPWIGYDSFMNYHTLVLGKNEDACLIRLSPGQKGKITSDHCFMNMLRVK